ncbi:anthranilate phosphoribosyltransferase [Flavobacterium urocaniciphilum]|uniref:Anthranilate phosphoribosyltransferase n=1 Tax=Flavobacterium urocaniciphilum TaxID=1299341 RepID=A0A1H8ZIL3_9FLAO|nr:anthranilate phosphoribosyltransferase [Flavobacterium urocaniciphilum]SEP64286.1 anthranilate phosphoribosyltransferase [Flavobacterium urocaniciphilum]
MKNIINRLINHEILSKEEAKNTLIEISNGTCNSHQIAAFLTVYMMRNITIDELSGFREALQELCVPVDFSAYDTIDLCGTGGDGKDTFNISTLSSFIVAGAGYKVAKHGNYGVSSISGSSNVMEQMGVKFSNNQDFLTQCLEDANIAILHAPLFHPAMKNVAPVRKDLGVKTFFNMLGPMVNPSFPKFQMVGVFSLELARMYAYLYQKTNTKYAILHGLEGFDEVSLTDTVKIITNDTETINFPIDFQFNKIHLSEIKGGNTVEDSAKIFHKILKGEGSEAQNNVVLVNSALAIQTISELSYSDSLEKAKESLYGKQALAKLNTLIKLSN